MRAYLEALVPTLAIIAGLILAIEIVVQHTVNAGEIPHVRAFGVHFNAASPLIWLLAAALLIGGFSVARCVQENAASAPGKCSCSAAQAPDKRQNLGPLGLTAK